MLLFIVGRNPDGGISFLLNYFLGGNIKGKPIREARRMDKKEWLGRLGLMFSLAVARLDQMKASKSRREELRQAHRFCRTLIEEYFERK